MSSIDTMCCPIFVPANRPERFTKAANCGADAIILDLEDAVAIEDKEKARAALNCDFTDLPVIVRINAIDTQWYKDDLERLSNLPISAVMLPKAEDVESIEQVSNILGDNVQVIALIETAVGLANARKIAATKGVQRLAFGSVDYCADMRCEHHNEALLYARCELVMASRLANIAPPIDGVTTAFDDPTITYNDTLNAKRLGLHGKLCIHPKQVAEIQRGFSPSKEDIAWANKILSSGDGAASVDGQMVDQPVRIQAQQILNRVKNQ